MIIELQTASLVKVWKQERLIVHDTTFDGWLFYTNLHGSAADPIATYATGELYCDLTDYIRTYPSVSTISFADASNPGTYRTFAVQVVGLISPESVLIPYQPLLPEAGYIIPPSRLLLEEASGSIVESEFYTTTPLLFAIFGASFADVTKRQVVGIETTGFSISCPGARKAYSPKLIRCGVEYALVRWVSFTGIARTHVFEVVKRKTSTDGAYSLMPIDSEYIDIKGRVDAFTLRLDGLDAYDMWYYSDMITSSKVEVSFDRVNYDRVQVTSNSVLLPDGNAGTDGVLEINVNWKRYDAVAM